MTSPGKKQKPSPKVRERTKASKRGRRLGKTAKDKAEELEPRAIKLESSQFQSCVLVSETL